MTVAKYIQKIVDSIIVSSPRKYEDVEKAQIVENWVKALSDLSKNQLDFGWTKAIKLPPGFGTVHPGWFRELCLSAPGSKSFEDDASGVWEVIVSNLASSLTPVFDDPAIAQTIRNMGGWKHLCRMKIDEIPFRKIDFIKVYATMKRANGDYDPILENPGANYHSEHGDGLRFIGEFKPEEKKQLLLEFDEKNKTEKKLIGMVAEKLQCPREELMGKTISVHVVGPDENNIQGEVIKVVPLKIKDSSGKIHFCRGEYTIIENAEQ